MPALPQSGLAVSADPSTIGLIEVSSEQFESYPEEFSQAYVSILSQLRSLHGEPDWVAYEANLALLYGDEFETLARYIESHPELWEQGDWVTRLINAWSDRSGGAVAFTFLEDTFIDVDIHVREQARRRSYAVWVAASPVEALAVLNQPDLGDERDYLTDAAIQSLNIQRIDTATMWLRYFEHSDSRDVAQAMIVRYLDTEALQSAAHWLRENQGIESVDAASQLAVRWVQYEPETAFQWFLDLPRTAAKDQALVMALKVWVSNDPEQAGDYINQLDPSPDLDVAVKSYALEAASYDKAAALEWADSIFNDQVREQTKREIRDRPDE